MKRVLKIILIVVLLLGGLVTYLSTTSVQNALTLANGIHDVVAYFTSPSNISAEDIHEFRVLDAQYTVDIPQEEVDKYYKSIGPDGLLDVVEGDPFCHAKAHNIGKAVYKETENLNESLLICGHRCSSGCVHGVFMELFKNETEEAPHEHNHAHAHVALTDDVRKKVQDVCTSLRMKLFFGFRIGGCAHAMGHALMVLSEYDVENALKECEVFGQGDDGLEYYCATGAYMERDIQYGEEDALAENMYPCREGFGHPAACFRYKIDRVYDWPGRDYKEIAEVCLSLSDEKERSGCFHGYGFSLYGEVSADYESIAKYCSYGGDLDKQLCIEAIAGKLSVYDEVGTKVACESFTEEDLRQICFDSVDSSNFGMERDFSLYHEAS